MKACFAAAFCAAAVLAALCSRRDAPSIPGSPIGWSIGARAGTLDLLGVHLMTPASGWAVGDIDPRGTGGAVLHTTDAGRTWTRIAPRTEVFTSVYFVTPQTGWIAGYAGRIDRSDDGGRTWRSQRREAGREIFNSIWAVDDHHAWAVAGIAIEPPTQQRSKQIHDCNNRRFLCCTTTRMDVTHRYSSRMVRQSRLARPGSMRAGCP